MHAFSAIAIVACHWDKINNKNLCTAMNTCSNDIKTNEPTVLNINEIMMVKTEKNENKQLI